jgi:cellulose synthase/poly-beta-1,6-N-acetylglucosamine synthase-like glycosyltransferase
VRGDAVRLRRCLEHLAAQDWPADRLQVVVAVDGPDPAAEATAREAGVEVVVLPTQSGSYAARNAALDALRDDVSVVVFTDADCMPAPGFVRAHVAAVHDGASLSGGAVEITLRDAPSPAEFLDSIVHLQQQSTVELQGYAATANLAFRREVIDALRFNSALQTGGDVEICERAAREGHQIVYTPDAVVVHPARQSTKAFAKKVWRICKGMSARPERWVDRRFGPLWPIKPVLWPIARARRVGASRGLLWDVQLALLIYARKLLIRASAWRVKRKPRR